MQDFCSLKKKIVINICDGMKVGRIGNIEFNNETGKICSIIIPCCNRKFSFICTGTVYVIPWDKIVRIGDDIVLINVCLSHFEREI